MRSRRRRDKMSIKKYLTLKNIEPDFAEPFVSAVLVIPAEEKKKEEIALPDMKKKEVPIVEKKDIETVVHKQDKVAAQESDSGELTYKGKELKELARNTVNCLGHISENYYFGITILISVLRGGNRKQIVKHKLNEVNEYGIYADMSRDDMRAVVQWMINNHYMLKTKAKYPVLHPTYNGNHFDECITKKQIKDLKKYLEDPNREVFEEEDSED